MATKYFSAINCNRVIAGVRFETVQHFAGSLVGIFATDNEKLQARLAADDVKATGVEEISEQDYSERLQKKTSTLDELKHSNNALPKVAALKGNGAPVVVEGADLKKPDGEAVATVGDVLKMAGDVAPVTAAASEPANVVTLPPVEPVAEPVPAPEPTAIATPSPAPNRKRNQSTEPK